MSTPPADDGRTWCPHCNGKFRPHTHHAPEEGSS